MFSSMPEKESKLQIRWKTCLYFKSSITESQQSLLCNERVVHEWDPAWDVGRTVDINQE